MICSQHNTAFRFRTHVVIEALLWEEEEVTGGAELTLKP